MEYEHASVLLGEAVESLNIKPEGIYVDATLGGGGHSLEIAKRLYGAGRLIGIDRDEEALIAAGQRLKGFGDRVVLKHGNFKNLCSLVKDSGYQKVDGILMDLGVSSHQLDESERGFSYMRDAPLDMRMDRRQSLTAREVVNSYTEGKIRDIIRKYGEERWAGRIAASIVREREKGAIETTGQLAAVIKEAIPAAARRRGPHPAKRTFQAIRIEVNDELGILEDAIKDAITLLNHGGRICIISFHSLEDRKVKEVFRGLENPCICPRKIPMCVCGRQPMVRVLTKKPVVPGGAEVAGNPRARSAGLRVAERL